MDKSINVVDESDSSPSKDSDTSNNNTPRKNKRKSSEPRKRYDIEKELETTNPNSKKLRPEKRTLQFESNLLGEKKEKEIVEKTTTKTDVNRSHQLLHKPQQQQLKVDKSLHNESNATTFQQMAGEYFNSHHKSAAVIHTHSDYTYEGVSSSAYKLGTPPFIPLNGSIRTPHSLQMIPETKNHFDRVLATNSSEARSKSPTLIKTEKQIPTVIDNSADKLQWLHNNNNKLDPKPQQAATNSDKPLSSVPQSSVFTPPLPAALHAQAHFSRDFDNLSENGDSSKRGRKNYKNMTRERRVEANARERSRVHTISAAFETLRHAVPSYSHNQRLSKLAILRIACTYIMSLATLVGHNYSWDNKPPSFADCVDECTKTIQTEGKAKRRN